MNKILNISTTQSNLRELQPEMGGLLGGNEVFHLEDITEVSQTFVNDSNIKNGHVCISTLHTTTTILVNEIHEPMLMLDLYRKIESMTPNTLPDYYHNSKYRTKNLEVCNKHCDTNGAAHLKAMMVGQSHLTLPIIKGKILLGKWQRIAFIDFDGPQERKVMLTIIG